VTTTEDRDFLPAMARPGLLALYDPFSRLLGAREVHWQLLAQAGIEPGHTVLEIGTGTGSALVLAARAVPDATMIGLDPDPQALAIAARKARRAGVEIRFDRGYADRLPYPDGSVDRVLSSFMLHHLPPPEQLAALREVRRVLGHGGRLHLVDFDGVPSGPVGRVMRVGRAHGHGHAQPTFLPVLATLAEAGFADATALAHGTNLIGRHTFYRAAG
jgi:ubiquinone/menaquinone biosynthesis C-methylase UbiE